VRQIRRCALLGAAALTLTACGAVTAPGAGAGEVITPAAQATEMAPPYGACEQVPTADMAGLPVEDALARSPELATLARLLPDLPLLSESLRTEPGLTVFAPSDAAFDQLRAELGQPAYDALLADKQRLDGLLSYHVSAKRLDAQQLVDAGKTTQLAYGDVTVGGTPDVIRLTSTSNTAATVLCGNVPTANATVFVIDEVLRPAT
jgi:uncharacterized surface protein with fasciclin (FAS1) repeats